MIECPICGKSVKEVNINSHIDADCASHIEAETEGVEGSETKPDAFSSLLRSAKNPPLALDKTGGRSSDRQVNVGSAATSTNNFDRRPAARTHDETDLFHGSSKSDVRGGADNTPPAAKRVKTSTHLQDAAPLADRMRPRSLDEIQGQAIVGPNGVLRGLIEAQRVPSMILWGGAGTGKTTIARLIAHEVGARYVEINATAAGVAECKNIFNEARNQLALTGRRTILFCDEIHRFNKGQQDVFLGPVESGQVTLIGATTENPSFKVQTALLSRCRTFTLQKLSEADVLVILERALEREGPNYAPSPLVDRDLLRYLSAFADGDARTALNLLELAMEASRRPDQTLAQLKASLTQTLVYDRAGDQHYDTISAFHKALRGSDADAALYYLARMIASGEDARYIARRLVVVASEDVGLADNTLLPLATAAYTAAETIGWPEARIPLAHATVALALAPKSTRAYRALSRAEQAVRTPGVAGLPIPMHLRNAPTRLMKDMGYGEAYKYNPDYRDGKVKQEYMPEKIRGMKFLDDDDLGTKVDSDLESEVGEKFKPMI